MINIQEDLNAFYEQACLKDNNAETREELRKEIERYFIKLDTLNISHPKDFNIVINNGELEVYFSKDYT